MEKWALEADRTLELTAGQAQIMDKGALHVVAKRLGHRDAMVTATIYAHVSDQQAETALSRFAAAVSGNS